MSNVQAVWGIDIGQCSLKALRCVPGENGEVIADAFDFVEYPKILSQPDVEPTELIKEAIEQFLSRNSVRGDKVAISVTGQAGLSRFFQPPPVEAKSLPDIVKFEAKMQIPFPLEDVIWDFQQIGGSEVDGLIVDAEVGLFAMKREAVYRALQPFADADIEVDYIQLSPLAAFNFAIKEILADVDPEADFDPENPPESLVLLAVGTETTDLVITNGLSVWMRNIPIGGNHFTKQLSRELKLTFTKAEHLKRNTRQAEDPKTLFQAMRPVFNDLVTEIQRSISYFRGINRNAKIGRMAMVGNAAKLPGLRQYLIKNLETEIVKFESFPTLEGEKVTGQKAFSENVLTFNVAYGLCLQGLGQSRIKTNLLPQEFLTQRMIRAKKPWALASLGTVMLGLTCSLLFSANGWWKVNEDRVVDGSSWKKSFGEVDRVSRMSKSFIEKDNDLSTKLVQFNALNDELTQSKSPFMLASEVASAVLQAFPEGPNAKNGEPFNPKEMDYSDRESIIIDNWSWTSEDRMEDWYREIEFEMARVHKGLKPFEDENVAKNAPVDPENPDAGAGNNNPKKGNQPGAGQGKKEAPAEPPPSGPGRVIVINCYHDHNDLDKYPDASDRERGYVQKTVIRNFLFGKVRFKGEELAFKDLGLKYPVFYGERAQDVTVSNPFFKQYAQKGEIPQKNIADWTAEEKRKYSPSWTVKRFFFRMEIAWFPTTFEAREQVRQEAAAQEEQMKKAEGQQPGQGAAGQPSAKKNPGNGNKPKDAVAPGAGKAADPGAGKAADPGAGGAGQPPAKK